MPLLVLLLMFVSLSSSEGLGDSARVFRSTREILNLPRRTAAAGHPVELTAVVTLVIPGEPQLYVQDSVAGISVLTRAIQDIKAGDLVLVEGKTAAGKI